MKISYLIILTIVFIIIHFGESPFTPWTDTFLFFSMGTTLWLIEDGKD